MTDLLLAAASALLLTTLTVPLAARLARRLGAVGHRIGEGPDDPTPAPPVPSLGGLAMLVGLAAGLGVAALSGGLPTAFASSEPLAILIGGVLIATLGTLDDVLGLPPTVKLAGQLVVATVVAVLGLQLVHFWVPGLGVIALSPDLALVLTVAALVAMINVVNLIDGVDGLAAAIVAVGAVTFLVFTLRSQAVTLGAATPTSAALAAALTAAIAVGFLVHNWYPSRVFMGDTGSMLLGLLLGAAGVSHVGRTAAPSTVDFAGTVPLVVPVLVLAVPFVDLVLAVVRRLVTGRPVTERDEGHLHHLLLAFGHSHRRVTVVLTYWSALVAIAALLPGFVPTAGLVVLVLAAALVGIVGTAVGARRGPVGGAASPDDAGAGTRGARTSGAPRG